MVSILGRKDVEGSLFVVKRSTQPRFQFIVMNRRNTDNLVESLLEEFEFEVQGPYLLYRNAAQEVNGIWFYNQRECDEVANLFSRSLEVKPLLTHAINIEGDYSRRMVLFGKFKLTTYLRRRGVTKVFCGKFLVCRL